MNHSRTDSSPPITVPKCTSFLSIQYEERVDALEHSTRSFTTDENPEVYRMRNCDLSRQISGFFEEVLGVPTVTEEDDFFELGGDSLASLRLVQSALKFGLDLRIGDLQSHRSPASLSLLIDLRPRMAPQKPPSQLGTAHQKVDPSPRMVAIQELKAPVADFTLEVLLAIPSHVDCSLMKRSLELLVERHRVLRLRAVSENEQRWSLTIEDVARMSSIPFFSLGSATTYPDTVELFHASEALGQSINAFTGAIVGALLVQTPILPSYLLVSINHLAVDGVSALVLTAELEEIYSALLAVQDIPEPLPRTTFKEWTEMLHCEAHSPARVAELVHWRRSLSRDGRLVMQADHIGKTSAVQSEISVILDSSITHALFRDCPKRFGSSVSNILLSSLVLTLLKLKQRLKELDSPVIGVEIDSHGRHDLGPDIRVAGSIGWFSDLYPVRFDLTGIDLDCAEAFAEVVRVVSTSLASTPAAGLGFGLLRYLNETTRPHLESLDRPQVAFNYVGRFERAKGNRWAAVSANSGPFGKAAYKQSVAKRQKPRMPMEHVLYHSVIVGQIDDLLYLSGTFKWNHELLIKDDVQWLISEWRSLLNEICHT